MKQKPIGGVDTGAHLPPHGYQGCSASGDDDVGGLLSSSTSTAAAAAAMMIVPPEKNYLVDDRGILNGTSVFSGPGPGAVPHPQMTRVNGLMVNYANRGGTIRSYHCRLCRKVTGPPYELCIPNWGSFRGGGGGARGNAVPVVRKLPERMATAFPLLKCLRALQNHQIDCH